MDINTFNLIVDATVEDTANLLKVKGGEYASDQDRLSNFKRAAELTGSDPLQIALIYMSKHFDAVCSYVRHQSIGKDLKLSEPIEGRFNDLINYCILMKAIIHEQRGNLS